MSLSHFCFQVSFVDLPRRMKLGAVVLRWNYSLDGIELTLFRQTIDYQLPSAISVITYLAITLALDAWFRSRGMGAGPSGQGVTIISAFNPFLALRALLSPASYPAVIPGTYTGLKALMLESPAKAWVYASLLQRTKCGISCGRSIWLGVV